MRRATTGVSSIRDSKNSGRLNRDDWSRISFLVSLLGNGSFWSGSRLAQKLKVSRTAIWKQITHLEDIGLSIERVHGRGYRLSAGAELLDRSIIINSLHKIARRRLTEIFVQQVVTSTNDVAMAGMQQGLLASGDVVMAEMQTAGRGRRGRSWQSPYGHNVYLSITWRYALELAALQGLSLVVGVGVIRALDEIGIASVKLKWPNDLVCDQGKLGGILIEMSGNVEGPMSIVVGIGLNFGMPTEVAQQTIDQDWADLGALTKSKLSRNLLAVKIIEHVSDVLERFVSVGFGGYRAEWSEHDWLYTKKVEVTGTEQNFEGVAQGVDPTGALVVCANGTRHLVRAGDVSVRRVS